jgi:addiction module RelE/StbE family toxin
MYKVVVKNQARKSLEKIDRRVVPKINAAIRLLQEYPLLGKPLEGECEGQRSLRVWPYRIIYEIYKQQMVILIIAIKHQ